MKRFRLKDSHPTKKKLDQLMDLMDELGLSISVDYTTVIHDKDQPDEAFTLCDIEDIAYPMRDLPPSTEYKLIIEKKDD